MIIRFTALFLFKIIFRLQTFGLKNIPAKGGFILASNHTSYLDPPALGAVCPRRLYFLAKKELFRNVLFGRFISSLNAIPIQGQAGDLRYLRWVIRELKTGKAVVIFPEGRRAADGALVEALRGVGFLACKANVCIVPAFIEGSNQALPIDRRFIRFKKIKVHFGQAVRIKEIRQQLKAGDLYKAIAEKTMEEISRLKDYRV